MKKWIHMESIIENECNSGEKKGCSPWDSGRPILAPTQHSSEVPWMSREFDGRPSSKSEDCCKQNTQWAQKRWSKRWPIVLKKRHRKMMPESMKKCYFHEFEQSTSGWPFRWSNRSVQPIYPMGYCSLSYIPHMWPFYQHRWQRENFLLTRLPIAKGFSNYIFIC